MKYLKFSFLCLVAAVLSMGCGADEDTKLKARTELDNVIQHFSGQYVTVSMKENDLKHIFSADQKLVPIRWVYKDNKTLNTEFNPHHISWYVTNDATPKVSFVLKMEKIEEDFRHAYSPTFYQKFFGLPLSSFDPLRFFKGMSFEAVLILFLTSYCERVIIHSK